MAFLFTLPIFELFYLCWSSSTWLKINSAQSHFCFKVDLDVLMTYKDETGTFYF